jgi:tRNA-Thr(GGU) m(6)t(6)A37 methyltransferase TsaA
MEIKPIGYIRTDFKDKFGIPRQSGRVAELKGRIVFEQEYRNSQALRGIEEFSHLWLIFGFSQAVRNRKALTVRPPRLGGNKRVGVFASRSPYRPNSLGLSAVKLEGVEKSDAEGEILIVSGVDMLDNTPIFDIKPYLPYADCKPDANGSFGEAFKEYSIDVIFPDELLNKLPEEKRTAAVECLKDDPRPSYHDDLRMYSMNFAGYDIHFKVENNVLWVVAVDILDFGIDI